MPYVPDYSNASREKRGYDAFYVRPPKPTADTLDEVAEKLRTTRSLAVAYAVRKALEELHLMSEEEIGEARKLINQMVDQKEKAK